MSQGRDDKATNRGKTMVEIGWPVVVRLNEWTPKDLCASRRGDSPCLTLEERTRTKGMS
jgi:hypothetical protein